MSKNRQTKAVFFFLLLVVGSYVSAGTTGTLRLAGIVQERLEISIEQNAVATALDFSGNGDSILVGRALENSNLTSGYQISVTSANAKNSASGSAFLQGNNSENPTQINYTLQYGANVSQFTSGSALVYSTNGVTGEDGNVQEIRISYNVENQALIADTYSDTLTFEISAK